ncbi:hypothetical protein [Luteimonas sp. A482]
MTTHSVSAFEITVRSKDIRGKDKRSQLDAIVIGKKQHDFFDVLSDFAATKSNFETVMINNLNRLVRIHDIQAAGSSRDTSFYVRQGTYGMPGEIVDSDSKTTAYKKRSKDSDVFEYFVQIRIPKGSKMGFALLHSIGNVGIKSWLSDELGLYVNNKLKGCGFYLRPLCSRIALQTYLKDANVRSIRVANFQPASSGDIANFLDDPRIEKDLILKKEGGFGKLPAFLRSGPKRDRLIAISDENCSDVKADVTFGDGRSRTISLEGSKIPKAKFYLTGEDVTFKDGLPIRQSVADFATSLLDDLLAEAGSGG